MKTETVEEFLARNGKIEKSTKECSLQELLLNEGLLDSVEAKAATDAIHSALDTSLN